MRALIGSPTSTGTVFKFITIPKRSEWSVGGMGIQSLRPLLANRAVEPTQRVGRVGVNPFDLVCAGVVRGHRPPIGKVGRSLYDRVLQGGADQKQAEPS